MRRRVSRCVLLALLAAFSAVPAAANPISVGSFYFEIRACDEFLSPGCQDSGFFVLDNNVNFPPGNPLEDLTFFARLQVDGVDVALTDYVDDVLAGGEYSDTGGLVPLPSFLNWTTASLAFYGGNFRDRGELFANSLSRSPDHFTADVIFEAAAPPSGVPERGSLFVVVIGLGALAVGRALLV